MEWIVCVICVVPTLFTHNSRFLCFSVSDGEIKSPNYPLPYHPNLQKEWNLWVPEGFQILLSITHLDIKPSLGCQEDSLIILDGKKVLRRFCGQENSTDHPGNEPILSKGNTLSLIFQTSDFNPELYQHTGFSALHKAIDIDECSKQDLGDGSGPLCTQLCVNTPGSYHCSCRHGYKLHLDQHTCLMSCGGCIFDEKDGHLYSPGYPGPSPPFLSCKYMISVKPRFTVTLNFTGKFHINSVNTNQGPRCLHHWLQVSIPGREPMKLCGGESPGLIRTNSNIVRLDYHTDSEGLSRGWSLDYHASEVKCPFPGNVANGRVTPVLSEYFFRHYIDVTCDQGYMLMMDGEVVKEFSAGCQGDGQWHPPLPECQRIYCGDPEPLLNGRMTLLSGSQNQYGSVVQYHCNEPFYALPDGINGYLTCEADGKWRSELNDMPPTCIPVCGQPTIPIPSFGRIIGGANAPNDSIPWQVMLSIDEQGFGRGGGMVIADRWILTGAVNVAHGNGNPVSHKLIRIYMGLNNVQTLLHHPVYAASVHVHPEYNNPTGMDYNNDIALIKLEEPITFNSSVMPLCLPEEGATYETGVIGLVSGFGLTDDGKKRILTNVLKYVELPVVGQDLCSASITLVKRRKADIPNLTDNMFCAGTPEGGKDSCSGDSGGPFTLSEDGRFWAAGIVSWGIDCGRRGTYGVYTRVANYLDWINKTMKEN